MHRNFHQEGSLDVIFWSLHRNFITSCCEIKYWPGLPDAVWKQACWNFYIHAICIFIPADHHSCRGFLRGIFGVFFRFNSYPNFRKGEGFLWLGVSCRTLLMSTHRKGLINVLLDGYKCHKRRYGTMASISWEFPAQMTTFEGKQRTNYLMKRHVSMTSGHEDRMLRSLRRDF